MRHTCAVSLAVVLALTGAAGAQLAPGLHPLQVTHDSVVRNYDLKVPAGYDGSTPLPLVIDFHGHGSNRAQQRLVSGFFFLADAESFLVAYPQGLYNSWNGGGCCGGAVANNVDDVGFTRALVEDIAVRARIDRRRVYATGISNGGFMTHRLACEASDLFAAFAPVAAFVAVSPCQPARPLPVQMHMGLTDLTVPYSTAAPTFAFWRANGQCVGATPDESFTVGASTCETYTNCADDVEVSMCSIVASPLFGGHVIYINDDIVVAAEIWEFVSRYALEPNLDHFKCYKAKDLKNPKFAATNVHLADQFGVNDGLFAVSKPALICNPVSVGGGAIQNPAEHLTCYKIKGPKLLPADRPTVDVLNDLSPHLLEAKKPAYLCAPSQKTLLP